MKATQILNKAKRDIRDFIAFELACLYSAKGWSKDEFGDLSYECNNVSMDVWVNDCEGNDYQERRKVERVVVNDEQGLFVELEDEREYYLSELDVYTLAEIANEIENEYKKTIKK